MNLSRRDWLRLAGVASGSALLGPGCAGRTVRTQLRSAEASDDEIAGRLRDAVAELDARWPGATGLARRHTHAAAALDVQSAKAWVEHHAGVVLTVRDAQGQEVEAVSSALDREAMLTLARALHERASAHRLTPAPAGRPRPAAPAPNDLAPRPPTPTAMQEHVAALVARADRHGSSRIVYRGAALDMDATTSWHANGGAVRHHHQLRQRSAVVAVASSGAAPQGAEVSWGRTLAPSATALADGLREDDLAAAVERLLRLTTPQALTPGPAEVVLDASVVALLFEALAGAWLAPARPPLPRWPASDGPGKAPWRLLSAPGTAGAYGGYAFDDLGAPASEQLILRHDDWPPGPTPGAEAATASSPGHFVRRGLFGEPAPALCHLVLDARPTAANAAALAAGLDAGYVLEDGTAAYMELEHDRVTVHARVAREVRKGATTGRAFAEIELRARASELLRAATGWSEASPAACRRQDLEGRPGFSSSVMPALLTRAELMPRRRP